MASKSMLSSLKKEIPIRYQDWNQKSRMAHIGGVRHVNWRLTVPLLVVVVAYVILGAAIFFFLEEPSRRTHENAKRKVLREFKESYPMVTQARVLELLNNFSREVYINSDKMHTYDLGHVSSEEPHHWDFGTAVYFVVTVITTIGYGDVVPVSSEGRIFCCVYALIGIPTCLVLLANVGGALYIVIKRLDNRIECLRRNPRRAQAVRCIALFAIGLCFFVLLPSYMFSKVEQWDFSSSVYYAFITLSTVGLGDYVAGRTGTPWYLAVLVIWLFLGLAWLSTTINSTQELITELLRDETNTDTKNSEGCSVDEAEQTTTEIHQENIKTISHQTLDNQPNMTVEMAVMETPSPQYVASERLEYGTSEFLQYTATTMNTTSPISDSLRYKLRQVSSPKAIPTMRRSIQRKDATRHSARTGQALPMVSYTNLGYDHQRENVDGTMQIEEGRSRDKGVQVNIVLMRGVYGSSTSSQSTAALGLDGVYSMNDLSISRPGDVIAMSSSQNHVQNSDRHVNNNESGPNIRVTGENQTSMWW